MEDVKVQRYINYKFFSTDDEGIIWAEQNIDFDKDYLGGEYRPHEHRACIFYVSDEISNRPYNGEVYTFGGYFIDQNCKIKRWN